MRKSTLIKVATQSILKNKMRTFLTMLGIVIGVASVIAMVALGTGAENAIKDKIARLGTTILQIDPQRVTQNGVATAQAVKLTMKDVQAIRDSSPHVIDGRSGSAVARFVRCCAYETVGMR